MNIQDRQNSKNAALKLLIYLGRQGEEWVDQLIAALVKGRHRPLAAAIAESVGKNFPFD